MATRANKNLNILRIFDIGLYKDSIFLHMFIGFTDISVEKPNYSVKQFIS